MTFKVLEIKSDGKRMRKVRHTWESAAQLKKGAKLGKMRPTWKNLLQLENVARLEKWATLGIVGKLGEIGHTRKSAPYFENAALF